MVNPVCRIEESRHSRETRKLFPVATLEPSRGRFQNIPFLTVCWRRSCSVSCWFIFLVRVLRSWDVGRVSRSREGPEIATGMGDCSFSACWSVSWRCDKDWRLFEFNLITMRKNRIKVFFLFQRIRKKLWIVRKGRNVVFWSWVLELPIGMSSKWTNLLGVSCCITNIFK